MRRGKVIGMGKRCEGQGRMVMVGFGLLQVTRGGGGDGSERDGRCLTGQGKEIRLLLKCNTKGFGLGGCFGPRVDLFKWWASNSIKGPFGIDISQVPFLQ